MRETTTKEQIFKRIRNANMNTAENTFADVDLKSDIYPKIDDELEVVFAEELNKVGGHFVYCIDSKELIENLQRLIVGQKWEKVFTKHPKIKEILNSIGIKSHSATSNMSEIKVSITTCEALVARTGSVLISSKQNSGRRLNFIPDTHVVIANREQIKANIKDALKSIQSNYDGVLPSMTTLITGPSRTADIEKTLVMGAHGPRSLIVFLTEDDLLK